MSRRRPTGGNPAFNQRASSAAKKRQRRLSFSKDTRAVTALDKRTRGKVNAAGADHGKRLEREFYWLAGRARSTRGTPGYRGRPRKRGHGRHARMDGKPFEMNGWAMKRQELTLGHSIGKGHQNSNPEERPRRKGVVQRSWAKSQQKAPHCGLK